MLAEGRSQAPGCGGVNRKKRTRIQLLGDFQVDHGGAAGKLPRSRQTRALLLHLALDPRSHRREELCALLFELPNDPRAALRWSLSKLRPLLGDGEASALVVDRETVRIDRERVSIDVCEIREVVEAKAELLPEEELRAFDSRLSRGYPGDLDDVGSVGFRLWLNAEREVLRELQRRVVDVLIARESLSAVERLRLCGRRVVLDPFDDDASIEYLRLNLEQRGLTAAREAFDEMRAFYREEGRSDDGLVAAWMGLADRARVLQGESATAVAIAAKTHVEPEPLRSPSDKPSLAVLDFDVIGSHEEGGVLAGGLAVDLNSRLAQLPNLFVIARASSARLVAQGMEPRAISRKLGVRYLVTGSTQRQDTRVRVTVALLDAAHGGEIWSEHYDRPLDDLFDVQDDITNSVVATLEPEIERAEMQRALIAPPDSLTAWEAYHRGLWHCFRFTASDAEIAHQWFERAVSMDPRFSRAHAGRSFAHYSRAFLNAVPDVAGEIRASLEAAQQSVGFDGRDAMGYWALGRALFLSRQHDDSLAAIDQALEINPNYAQGHYARGFVGIHSGIDDSSLVSLDLAERLSPFDPLLFAMRCSRAISLVSQGRYEEAAPWTIRATQEPNAHFHIYAITAAVLELTGRSEEAKNNARWVLERQPDYSVQVFQRSFPHKDEAAREAMLAALARAGIPRGH